MKYSILICCIALCTFTWCASNKDASLESFSQSSTMSTHSKIFKIPKDQIKHLIDDNRGWIASDMIMVDWEPIRFMYREKPMPNVPDSWWRFFSGKESDEYANNPKNNWIYSLNAIANYDSDIIPFLDSPYNTAFERDPKTGKFVQISGFFPTETN
jgi:hypothetical protein